MGETVGNLVGEGVTGEIVGDKLGDDVGLCVGGNFLTYTSIAKSEPIPQPNLIIENNRKPYFCEFERHVFRPFICSHAHMHLFSPAASKIKQIKSNPFLHKPKN